MAVSKNIHLRMPEIDVERIRGITNGRMTETDWILSALRRVAEDPPAPSAPQEDTPPDGDICFRLPQELLALIDRVRGPAKRHSWMRWALQLSLTTPQ